MLFHSTMRKCNSLLEEKILLLYWPPPKIPPTVYTLTHQGSKKTTQELLGSKLQTYFSHTRSLFVISL